MRVLLCILGNDLLIAFLTVLAIRIFIGRPVNMNSLKALTDAIQQLATDVAALSNAGVVSSAALDPLTASITQIDGQVKALIPAVPAPTA